MAGDVGLDCDAVAGLEGGDGGVDGEDCAGRFMAEDLVGFYYHRPDAAGMPEVDVGAAYASAFDADGDFARFESFAFLYSFEGGFGFCYP